MPIALLCRPRPNFSVVTERSHVFYGRFSLSRATRGRLCKGRRFHMGTVRLPSL